MRGEFCLAGPFSDYADDLRLFRYIVDITLGGQSLEVIVDTGSTGQCFESRHSLKTDLGCTLLRYVRILRSAWEPI